MNKSPIDNKETTYIACFLLGIIFKEIVTFVTLGGLGEDYPLSKCLFYMFIATVALILLAVPEAMSTKEKIVKMEKKLSEIESAINVPCEETFS